MKQEFFAGHDIKKERRHRREAEVRAFPALEEKIARLAGFPRLLLAFALAITGATVAWLIVRNRAFKSRDRFEPIRRRSPGDIEVAPAP